MQIEKTSDKKVFYRTVVALVVPMALQNLINVGVQSSDVIMLSGVSETVLSAASLAGQVQYIMTLVLFGLGSGALVLTAQYWGKGNIRAIEKITTMSVVISFVVAAVFFCLAFFLPRQVMSIFSPDAEIVEQGVKYLKIASFNYVFMAVTSTYLIIMRSVEKVVFATVVYSISFVTNVFLNAVLIYGLFGAPRMEIEGAALATTIARFIELIIVAVYALSKRGIKINIKDILKWDKNLIKDFMKYSAPTILNELLWGLAISTSAVIIGHLSASAVAANSVAQVMRQLALVVTFGIGNTTAIMLGKTIGAGDNVGALRDAKRFLRLGFVTGIGGALLVLIIRPFVVSAIKITPLAKDYLSLVLIYLSVQVIFAALNSTMIVGIFRSGGDTKVGLIIDVISMWGVTVLLGALAAFVFKWPVEIVFLILMADELVKAPMAFARYKSNRWLRNVTRDDIKKSIKT